MFRDRPWRIEFADNLFLIVTSSIETRFRIQTAKIGLSPDVVPMRMCDEDGGQLRQIGSVGAQRFVGGLCGIGAGSRVYSDQLSPIVGDHEIVFRELETREPIDPARNDLRDAP